MCVALLATGWKVFVYGVGVGGCLLTARCTHVEVGLAPLPKAFHDATAAVGAPYHAQATGQRGVAEAHLDVHRLPLVLVGVASMTAKSRSHQVWGDDTVI